MNTAQKVRLDKEKNPQAFCEYDRCLYRIRDSNWNVKESCTKRRCPKHK